MEDFDISAAVDDVSSGLGIEITTDTSSGSDGAGEGASVAEGSDGLSTTSSEPTASPTPAPAPGTTAAPAPAGEAATTAPALRAPASWRPEAKAEFDKLPPVIKDEVIKREEDILRGIGEYKAAATFGHAIDKAIQPFAPTLRQYGIDPVRHVGELFSVHQRLAMGSPEVKQATLAQIARDFGIPLPTPQASEDSPYVDPEVAALRTQMQQLHSLHQQLVNQQTQQQTQQIQAQRAQIENGLRSELNTFASDPEHAFFDEVADDMAMLIQSGRAPSLKQAYDLAIRMQPAILEKENLRVAAKEASKKLDANGTAAAKTTAARNATGVNVKGQAAAPTKRGPSPGAGLQNLGDSIEDAFDKIMASEKS